VFWRESRRLSNVEGDHGTALAHRIAADEAEHERLLIALRSCCAVPDDEASIRSRAHRFFLRTASREVALHFAKIAALDSGVCLILAALIRPLSRSPCVVEILERIRADEGRHVKFSRQHAYECGADRSLLGDTAVRIDSDLVGLLYPIANSFEELGLDADRLFRRINRGECRAKVNPDGS
jgi:hypothetical protein